MVIVRLTMDSSQIKYEWYDFTKIDDNKNLMKIREKIEAN